MRKIWTKAALVTATGGALVLGGAGMASADTGDHPEQHGNQTDTRVDNRVDDLSDVSLNDILNGTVDVDDVLSGNNVLNGVDTDVTDILNGILSGNSSDVDTDADVDAESSSSSDSDGDGDGGLLGGILG